MDSEKIPVAVTTSVRSSYKLVQEARRVAAEITAPFTFRDGLSLADLAANTGARRLLIIGTQRISLYDPETAKEYVFHPNMIPVRAFSEARGARDLFLEATDLQPGQRLLDCTVGFGAEATLAALAVGSSGLVVGLESVPELAAVTREGLRTYPLTPPVLADAMRRVIVISADYRDYLSNAEADSFDVIYFDPFFAESLSGAENTVGLLAHFGNPEPLAEDAVHRAVHLSAKVVIKHPKYLPLPPGLAASVTQTITARRSRLAYSVIKK